MDDKNTIPSGVTLSVLQTLQEEYRVSASKALGQNFLVDPNIPVKIANEIGNEGNVIEIGPGIGSLTVALANRFEKVVAVELDQHLISPLESVLEMFGVSGKVDIINDDAMKVDFESLCKDNNANVIAGNLPYNISAPLLADICQNAPSAKTIIAMVQKEVGERLSAQIGTRAVSSITLKCQFFMDISVLFSVSPQSFIPKPNVDSVVIKMTRKDRDDYELSRVEIDDFFSLIDLAFSQRRKMLRKSLESVLKGDGEQIFVRAQLDPTLRPEACTLDDFYRLYREINKTENGES
jgi:16S rRNA (adenine1518-N6/adenine1519-N6)-dimethyltransferase